MTHLPARPTDDLRTRRRNETRAEISSVAAALFERDGLVGTTVDDIAHAAGISPRTFFRYFPTKEEAALLGQDVFDDAVDALEFPSANPREAMVLVEDMYETLFQNVAATDPSGYLAMQRLILREPALRLASTARYNTTAERLRSRLSAALGASDEMMVRLIVEITGATVNAALEQWAHGGGDEDLVDLYRRARSCLRFLPS